MPVLLTFNLQTKFEMSSFIRSRDMAWARKCTNEARDPDHAHLGDSVFYVDGKPIDFVSSFPHLGHVITDTLNDGPDITKRLEILLDRSTTYCAFW